MIVLTHKFHKYRRTPDWVTVVAIISWGLKGMKNRTDEAVADEVAELFSDANIVTLRAEMLRFATLQLRDASMAEDAVQEALIAAHTAKNRFEGRAQMKTWVFSILRNKIIDIIRERTRRPTQSMTHEDGSDDELNELFDENGYWRKEDKPSDWGQPELAFSNDQFWQVFDICLNAMKENIARVFMMREIMGLDTAEICAELAISESNCWVILHRARARLRLCLEDKWIGEESTLC